MPFVDAIVLYAEENRQGCPASHPEELIFEVWPGTRALCDYLESYDLYNIYILDYDCAFDEEYSEINGRNYSKYKNIY